MTEVVVVLPHHLSPLPTHHHPQNYCGPGFLGLLPAYFFLLQYAWKAQRCLLAHYTQIYSPLPFCATADRRAKAKPRPRQIASF